MNSLKLCFLGAFCALGIGVSPPGSLIAQTTLVPGELFLTGYNSVPATSNDNFSFVLLQNVTATTVIYFSDKGWFDNGGGVQGFLADANTTQDGVIRWTAPASGVACGTEIHIQCEWPNALSATVGTVVGVIQCTGGAVDAGSSGQPWIEFNGAGDQLFAFQSSSSPVTLTPTLIAGFDGNGGWVATTSATVSSVQSAQPTALGAANAPTFAPEADNYRYNCPTAPTSATRASLFTSLTTFGNWISQNSTYYVLPTGCSWNVTDCTPLEAPLHLQAMVQQGQALLTWHMAGNDLSHYRVQRSIDGSQFEDLAEVRPLTGQHTFAWTDATPFVGESWYRIVEVSQSGESTPSEAVALFVKAHRGISCISYAGEWLQITLQESLPLGTQLEIMGLQGQRIFSAELPPGDSNALLHIGSIRSGIYLCKVEGPGLSYTGKLLIHN